MSTMTSVEHRPRRRRSRASANREPGWAVHYRYPEVRPGMDWVASEAAALHFAVLYRRYGATVHLMRRDDDGGDTWYRLREGGTDLTVMPPPGRTP